MPRLGVVAFCAAIMRTVAATHKPVLLAGAMMAIAAPAAAQEQVQTIKIVGAQRIEEATIRSYLEISEGDVLAPSKVNAALKRLFSTGLFQDARIAPQPNGVLLVEVVENPIINQIAFEGNRAIDDELLNAQVRSRPRTPFTLARAEADAQIVLDAYRAAGRYSATVEPKIIQQDNNRVDLVFEINEGEAVGVSAINFVGNSEYSDRRLRRVIQTEESSWWKVLATSDSYDPDRLEFDKDLLRRFYFARGYADFEVLSAAAELNPERDGFFITFTVAEGEQYEVGDVSVVSSAKGVDAAQFEDLAELSTGDTYDSSVVQDAVGDMQRRAGVEGVNFIDIRPQSQKRRGENNEPIIDIAYEIREAPRVYVERIDIEGNVRTLDHVIRREFELVEGDAFNAYKLQASRTNARALGFFSTVEVTTERGSADDRVVVKTRVEERSTGDINFGVGFSSAESLGGQVSLTERNFLGRGQFVRASVSITNERQFFDFRFTEPYFLDRKLSAGFDIYHREIDNQDESSFDTRKTGLRPRIGFPLSENTFVNFNYTIENDEIRDVPRDASPLISGDLNANGERVSDGDRGARLVSSVGYDISYDQRNDRLQPTSGYILSLSQDFAGVGGDAFFIKTEGSAKVHQSFFREDVVASLELAGGAIVGLGGEDDVRISDRFDLGGDSFRGFDSSGIGPRDTNQIRVRNTEDNIDDGEPEVVTERIDDALGGKYYAVARADVSFPIGLPEEYGVFGGVFADAGSLWGLDQDSYTAYGGDGEESTFRVDDALQFRAAVGASVFWSSPFGPIRLNFATPLIKQDEDKTEFFRFTAGTRF